MTSEEQCNFALQIPDSTAWLFFPDNRYADMTLSKALTFLNRNLGCIFRVTSLQLVSMQMSGYCEVLMDHF
jgi:hypothetical protein